MNRTCMTRLFGYLFGLAVTTVAAIQTSAVERASLEPLRVADNGRFFVTISGRPFFWLGDTVWQLIHDLDEAEIRRYFADRQEKGFTVIQTVVLAELRSDKPNAFGHFPLSLAVPTGPLFKTAQTMITGMMSSESCGWPRSTGCTSVCCPHGGKLSLPIGKMAW